MRSCSGCAARPAGCRRSSPAIRGGPGRRGRSIRSRDSPRAEETKSSPHRIGAGRPRPNPATGHIRAGSAPRWKHARTVVEFARRDHPAAHRRQGWCTASALEVRSVIANFDGAGGDAIISLSPARGGLALSGMAMLPSDLLEWFFILFVLAPAAAAILAFKGPPPVRPIARWVLLSAWLAHAAATLACLRYAVAKPSSGIGNGVFFLVAI